MPCNCGKRTNLSRLMTATSRYPSNGGWPLGNYPDCTELYPAGSPSSGTGVYIVGRGTDFEKLFARTKLPDATSYVHEHRAERLKLEKVPTVNLCKEAVIDVYGR